MLESVFAGLWLVLAWPTVGYLLLGIATGLWLGAVPGLGGVIGIVILLPFTYGMEASSAFALLLGLFAVTATSDSIASVLLGIPGTAASQATVLDGHPLAKKGEAARALGAAISVSAFGGIIGGLALALSLPFALPVILAFGSPDYFLLGALGLVLVGSLSGASIAKGLAAAAIGLLISQIGFPVRSDVPRYWFDQNFLIDGVPLIAAVLGLFAIPELLDLTTRRKSISEMPPTTSMRQGMLQGVRDVIQNKWLSFRCSILGVYIGLLPGLGGAIADWIAYGHTVTSARDRSQFGKGDIRGVIGPEATNNAVNGGSLIPTVALGIPGSAGMAILLGAFVLQGLTPGPTMLTANLSLTFSFVWTLILANLIGAGVLFLSVRPICKLAFVDSRLLVPLIVIFVFMGAWISLVHLGSWVTLLLMGLLGVLMRRGGWPRPPLILGFVLGPILENALVLSYQAYSWQDIVTRPLTMTLALGLLISVALVLRGLRKQPMPSDSKVSDAAPGSDWVSLGLAIGAFGVMALAFLQAQQFPFSAALSPLAITSVGMVASLWVVVMHLRRRDSLRLTYFGTATASADLRAAEFSVWLVALVPVSLLIGQIAALCLFVLLYLWRWGKFGPLVLLVYSIGALTLLIGLYDRTLNTNWLSPALALF